MSQPDRPPYNPLTLGAYIVQVPNEDRVKMHSSIPNMVRVGGELVARYLIGRLRLEAHDYQAEQAHSEEAKALVRLADTLEQELERR